MPSLKDIKTRISSVKSTRQTTRAMKMVAAAKLRRSQDAITNARPYAEKINEVVKKIASTNKVESPFFAKEKEENTKEKILVVLVTSDRGLCGGFNANISKKALEFIKANSDKEIEVLSVGKKGGDYLKRRGYTPTKVVLNLVKEISFNYTREFAGEVIKKYFDEKFSQVVFFYNEFQSVLVQIPKEQVVLPIASDDSVWEQAEGDFSKDYMFEPSPNEMVQELLEKSLVMQIYKCLLESLASEHGARMNSMENATNNAGELIDKLTLTYNNLRQAAITNELIEITSGAEALN